MMLSTWGGSQYQVTTDRGLAIIIHIILYSSKVRSMHCSDPYNCHRAVTRLTARRRDGKSVYVLELCLELL